MTEIEFPDLNDWTEEQANTNLVDPDLAYERKYDGTAAMVQVFMDQPTIIWGRGILKDGSRQNYTNNFPEVAKFFDHLSMECTLLGELAIFERPDVEKFQLIQKRAIRKKDIDLYAKQYPATFLAFDLKCLNGVDLTNYAYADRRFMLEDFTHLEEEGPFKIVESYTNTQDKWELLGRLEEEKFEGIVIKNRNEAWGTKQWKYKPTVTEDVIWYGEYKEGTGRNAGKVGSLICYQYLNGKLKEVTKASGLDDELRSRLTDLTHSGKVSKENPMVIEVEAMAYLPSGKLRHSRWSRERHDKGPTQCRREL